MWTPALRLILVAAAALSAGWFGSSYLRRRQDDAGEPPSPNRPPLARDDRPIRTLTWCDECLAHMPLDHRCDDAGIRSAVQHG